MSEPTNPKAETGATRPTSPPQFDSVDLFAGQRIVHIQHDDECYRLLITKNNKLILQK